MSYRLHSKKNFKLRYAQRPYGGSCSGMDSQGRRYVSSPIKESAAYYSPAFSFRSLQLNIMKKHEPLSGCTWGKTTKLTRLYLSMKQE